jgi:membrane-associated phospholipid phosphatase
LLLPVAWLASTRDEVRRYSLGFLAVTLAGFACFCLFPVLGPRPLDAPLAGMYGCLICIDLPLNTFPSMHMAMASYSAAVAVQLYRGRFRAAWAGAMWIWVLLIGYSALATKQHYLVDLPSGILLGWVVQRWAWS